MRWFVAAKSKKSGRLEVLRAGFLPSEALERQNLFMMLTTKLLLVHLRPEIHS